MIDSEYTAATILRTALMELEANELRLFKLGFTELMKKVYAARLTLSEELRSFEAACVQPRCGDKHYIDQSYKLPDIEQVCELPRGHKGRHETASGSWWQR